MPPGPEERNEDARPGDADAEAHRGCQDARRAAEQSNGRRGGRDQQRRGEKDSDREGAGSRSEGKDEEEESREEAHRHSSRSGCLRVDRCKEQRPENGSETCNDERRDSEQAQDIMRPDAEQ